MNDKWKNRFLSSALHAAEWSRDPSTKVGAVIVDPSNKSIASSGFNGFPRGVVDSDERYDDRPTKYSMVVHAELNAIIQAGKDARGSWMFCTMYPCNECAKAIIQAGIERILIPADTKGARWMESHEVASTMFKETGITVEMIS